MHERRIQQQNLQVCQFFSLIQTNFRKLRAESTLYTKEALITPGNDQNKTNKESAAYRKTNTAHKFCPKSNCNSYLISPTSRFVDHKSKHITLEMSIASVKDSQFCHCPQTHYMEIPPY